MTTMPDALAYGYKRLVPDANTLAAYGARLIYNEVREGGDGTLPDRQDYIGANEIVTFNLIPALKVWRYHARNWIDRHINGQASTDIIEYNEGVEVELNGEYIKCDVIIKGSPQQSYGYLYVTALLQVRGE